MGPNHLGTGIEYSWKIADMDLFGVHLHGRVVVIVS